MDNISDDGVGKAGQHYQAELQAQASESHRPA